MYETTEYMDYHGFKRIANLSHVKTSGASCKILPGWECKARIFFHLVRTQVLKKVVKITVPAITYYCWANTDYVPVYYDTPGKYSWV